MIRCSRGVQFVLAAFLAAPSAGAQYDRYAPIVLQLPASARATGVGGAFTAVRDIESIFANAAFSGIVTGTAVSAERFRASSQGTIASSMTLGQFGVAVGVQYLDYRVSQYMICDFTCSGFITDPPPVSSKVLNEQVDNPAAASSLSAAVGVSTTYKGFRWGAALKYVEERIATHRESSPVVDVGVAKEGGPIIWGLSLQNFGRSVADLPVLANLPTRVTLGAASAPRPVGPFDLALVLSLSHLRDGFMSPAGGMEWSLTPLEGYTFVARVGVRRPELEEQRPLAFGASFSFDRLSVDYAFDDVRGGAGHRLGLRVR